MLPDVGYVMSSTRSIARVRCKRYLSSHARLYIDAEVSTQYTESVEYRDHCYVGAGLR